MELGRDSDTGGQVEGMPFPFIPLFFLTEDCHLAWQLHSSIWESTIISLHETYR